MAKRKPGKYDHLLPKLKEWVNPDDKHQERVNDTVRALRLCDSCGELDKLVFSPLNEVSGDPACEACGGSGFRKLSAGKIGLLYAQSRTTLEQLTIELAHAALETEALSQMLIASQASRDTSEWGAFGASDRSIKLVSGDTIRVQPEIFPTASDKGAFRKWCYDNGKTDIMELPASKMNELCKDRLLKGQPDPDGVKVYYRTKIVFTPLKPEARATTTDDVDSF